MLIRISLFMIFFGATCRIHVLYFFLNCPVKNTTNLHCLKISKYNQPLPLLEKALMTPISSVNGRSKSKVG